MYHVSSSSSSSQGGSMAFPSSGLTRYGSAPDSFLSTAVDSVMIRGGGGGGPTLHFSAPHQHRYFSSSADNTSSVVTSSESTCQANPPSTTPDPNKGGTTTTTSSSINRLQRSYGFNEIAVGGDFATSGGGGGGGGGSLFRHSSSPAGFLNHHHHHHLTPTTTTTTAAAAAADNAGFPVTRRRIGSYDSKGVSDSSHGISRLNSQLSFTRQESLSHISEESENVADGISADNSRRKAAYSYVTCSFGMGSWDDTNAIVFSAPPSKQAKNVSGDVVHCLDTVESQFQFSLPQTAMEMATMEKLLQIPQDSVPCKIGAKRGCATHPRSIAERERRTRISGKLKKLQELVPNMDKQTSYADMLDLAVHHIKGLQNQVQKLNNELEDCKCGCKQAT